MRLHEEAERRIRLLGKKALDLEAVFDAGISRSVISMDLAERLGTYHELLEDHKFSLPTGKRGETIRIISRVSAPVEFDECRIPSTPSRYPRTCRGNTLIVGRDNIYYRWGVVLAENPRLRKKPSRSESTGQESSLLCTARRES